MSITARLVFIKSRPACNFQLIPAGFTAALLKPYIISGMTVFLIVEDITAGTGHGKAASTAVQRNHSSIFDGGQT